MKTAYILISPAYNEAKHIEQLIKSVAAQTILPKKWLIVNDGSTDATGEIISRYEADYEFITQLKLSREDVMSYYSRKTSVFLTGYEKIKDNAEYDFVGSLDADITLEPNYYEEILQEFYRNPRLGIAGGAYVYQIDGQIQKPLIDELCVPGSVQMFRRECYEQVGGYIPLKYGGDDTLIGIMANMNGWQTKHFPEYQVVQHRAVGTAGERSILQARFGQGLTEYGLATHPMFMLAKSLRRAVLEKPYFVGSIARFVGFLYGYCLREERQLPPEVIRFVRKEQIGRLWSCIRRNPR